MLLTHGLEYTSGSRVVEANKPPRINLLDLIARFFLHVKSHSCCYLLGTQPLTPGFPNPAHETPENSPAQSTASTPGGEREPSRLGRLLSGGGACAPVQRLVDDPGVGKCSFLGILNITFKYLLEIISPTLGWCSIGTFTNPCDPHGNIGTRPGGSRWLLVWVEGACCNVAWDGDGTWFDGDGVVEEWGDTMIYGISWWEIHHV